MPVGLGMREGLRHVGRLGPLPDVVAWPIGSRHEGAGVPARARLTGGKGKT